MYAGCTGCNACAQVCPDFVFQVWKLAEPVDVPAGLVADALVHREIAVQRERRS